MTIIRMTLIPAILAVLALSACTVERVQETPGYYYDNPGPPAVYYDHHNDDD